MSDVRRTGERRELRIEAGNRVDEISPGRLRSFRYQRRPVDDDCSPGLWRMAQDEGVSSITFDGKIDRCRQSQGWTTASNSKPERDGKDRARRG